MGSCRKRSFGKLLLYCLYRLYRFQVPRRVIFRSILISSDVDFWKHREISFDHRDYSLGLDVALRLCNDVSFVFNWGRIVATHRERVSTALDLLTEGLAPYVEEKLRAIHRDNWKRAVKGSFRDDRGGDDSFNWDAHALLTVMWDQWNSVFRHDLGHTERSLVSELREFRNKWAHQQPFDFDDAFRVLDSVNRLLKAVNAENSLVVQREKSDLLESHVAEEVNNQVQNTAFQRNKWWIIVIYGVSCSLIVWHLLQSTETGSLGVISVVLLVFIYLTYQQFKLKPPILYGPRECDRCHRIVYRQRCPYCDGNAAP